MRLTSLASLALLMACGRVRPSPEDSAPVALAAAPSERRVRWNHIEVVLTGDRAVQHGECPTECCRYGDWMIGPTTIRDRPDSTATIIGRSTAGMAVHADSGLTIVDPVGLAITTRPIRLENAGDIPAGDTIRLLTPGETGFTALWNGRFALEAEPASSFGMRLVRLNMKREWWAYVTAKSGSMRGWIDVDRTLVKGAVVCGSSADR